MWQPGDFLIASDWTEAGFENRYGYTYRGLGIYQCGKGSPKGRRPPTWSLRHLGSGHTIALIDGKVADAFVIASKIADCGDWSFDGIEGWKNVDPEIPAKVREIMEAHPKAIRRTGGPSSPNAARAIAIARAQ